MVSPKLRKHRACLGGVVRIGSDSEPVKTTVAGGCKREREGTRVESARETAALSGVFA